MNEKTDFKQWDTRQVVFTYRIPVPSDYHVGVAMFESGTGRPMENSPVQTAVLAGLQKAGFKTRDVFALLPQQFKAKPSPERACDLLKGKVDILLLGEVSLRFSSRSSYEFIFYRSRGIVQGFSLSNGTVLATVDIKDKGGGLDDDRAAKKAILNLAKSLQKEIGPALEKGLE